MNIVIISPGKSKKFLGEEIVIEYTNRLIHYTSIDWKYIQSGDIKDESEKILKSIPENSHIVLLDERGKMFSSIELSNFIEKRLNESVKNLVFIIGGSYGVHDSVREKANTILSLSNLVFPHELVRGILAEQLYRSFSIIKGEKYHHA